MFLRALFFTGAFSISSITTAETCDGVISVLGISDYVEGESEAGLTEASIAHQKRYRDHGVSDNEQVVVPLVKYDEESDNLLSDSTLQTMRQLAILRTRPSATRLGTSLLHCTIRTPQSKSNTSSVYRSRCSLNNASGSIFPSPV